MSTPVTEEIVSWFRSRPSRRPQSDREVELPTKDTVNRNIFSGLFRRKMAERQLNEIHDELTKLDAFLAKENFMAVTAAYYQFAVEAAVRIKRPELIREFETERDRAILAARSAKPMRQRKAK